MPQLKITAAMSKHPSNTGLISQTHSIKYSIAATTNDYKFSSLKQYLFFISQFLCIRSLAQHGSPGCLLQVSRAEVTVVTGLCSFLESLWMRSFWLWAEFILCGCRTEVPISFLAVGQGLFSTSRDHLAGSLLQSQQWRVKFLSAVLLPPSSAPSLWLSLQFLKACVIT